MTWPTREQAWDLLNDYTKNPGLIKHGLAVEIAMRAYARKMSGDEEKWGVVGLIHDFEYEKYPDLGPEGHPFKGAQILREMGWDEDLIRAILCHAPDLVGITPENDMEKAIFAVDELTGLITAVALVRPNKSILDVKVKSVKKKWKDKGFARGVNREDIEKGAATLGVDLNEHIATVLEAMIENAEVLGLVGEPA